MNIASIDIGSNTVILLIAQFDKKQSKIIALENHYSIPRMGKDVHITGKILEEKIDELLQILSLYNKIAKKNDCKQILIAATKAFRDAQNANFIINKVWEELGLKIQIINGEQEAYLSFIGAISEYPKNEDYFVIDIGGGSTELILGNHEGIKYKKSFNLGLISLKDIIYKSNSFNNIKYDEINNYIDFTIKDIDVNVELKSNGIAVSGTPTTIASMMQGITEFDERKVDSFILDKRALENLIKELSSLAPRMILEKYGNVVSGREDLILGGSILLYRILSILNLNEVTVSTRGLRYGIIIDYFSKNLKD